MKTESACNDGTYITNHRRSALHCTSREIFHIRRILSLHRRRYHRRRNNIINPRILGNPPRISTRFEAFKNNYVHISAFVNYSPEKEIFRYLNIIP